MIYLDSAATTKMSDSVLDAMLPYLKEQYGNPGTMYSIGRDAAKAVERARNQVASFFRAKPENIIFTSGGSEGNSMVIGSYGMNGGISASYTGHDSALFAAGYCTELERLTLISPGTDGCIGAEEVNESLDGKTELVSVEYVNNETGVQNDIESIGRLCREKDIRLHCDCVQAAGNLKLDMEKLPIDYATISAHKIHGPKGVGALYARNRDALSSIVFGGLHQEYGLRGGTENVAGIVGLGQACEEADRDMHDNILKISLMKQGFCANLCRAFEKDNFSGTGITPNFGSHFTPGKILSLSIDGVYAQSLVLMMDALGICISAGSACHSQEDTPSRVLKECGFDDMRARSTVRISFDPSNTEEEIKQAAAAMAGCITTLRSQTA